VRWSAQGRKPRSREESNREILEYLEVPLRRPWHVLIPFVLCVAAVLGASYVLPSKYRSSTLILVEAEKVPESMVGNVATERIGRRLQTVKQEVLSRTRLEAVIQELDPYGMPARPSMTTMVEWMRSSIEVTVKGNDAFGIDFVHRDPHMAQKVANRLTQLFIEETVQARKQQVGEAYQFIESELEDAKRELEKREEALRHYKEAHMGTLPEQMNANLSTLQRLQLEQQAVAESLRAAMDRLVLLESAAPVGKAGAVVDARSELTQLRGQLAALRTRYTDEHPDVKAVLTQIAAAEKTLAASGRNAEGSGPSPQVEQARLEVKNLREKREDLDRKIGSFQARVEQAPRTEQDIVTLTRDFQKLNENYLALLNKKLDAQMAAKLEQRWQGDRFRILDPASLPEYPFYPNRLLFLLFGIVAGLAAGVAVALAAEFFDHSIRNVRELEEAVPFPVLAHLPLITGLRPTSPRARRGQGRPPRRPPEGEGPGTSSEVTYLNRARNGRRLGSR